MKLSRFNHWFTLDNKHYLFNAFRRSLYEVEDEVRFVLEALTAGEGNDCLYKLEPEIRKILHDQGFIIEESTDEHALLSAQREQTRLHRKVIGVTICPTIDCNFGCPYCFEGNEKPKVRMSFEVMQAIVTFLQNLADDSTEELHVTWFGGEPLLAMPQISQLTGMLKEEIIKPRGWNYKASIITNGYGLTPKTAQRLQSLHINFVQITLDGTAEHHNSRRFMVNGIPTFQRIVDNVVSSCDLIPISIRVNLDQTNVQSFVPLVQYLHSLGLKDKISIYPAFTRDGGDGEWAGKYRNMGDFVEDKIRIHQAALDHGIRVLSYPNSIRLFCGASRPTFWVIHPNGDLHKCWDTVNQPTEAIGNLLMNSDTIHNANKWENWSPFNNRKCRECNVMPLCMGGCAHLAFQKGGEPQCEEWKFGLLDVLKIWIEDQIGRDSQVNLKDRRDIL